MKNIFFFLFLCCFIAKTSAKDIITKLDTLPFDLTENNPIFQTLVKNAKAGDTEAMLHLGRCYLTGSYVKVDLKKAFDWTLKAAEGNYIPAWAELGYYYKYGTGVPLDYAAAYQFFIRGASYQDPLATYMKGYMEYKGLGCTQDYKTALLDFTNAANKGSEASMYMLGIMNRNGFGTKKDVEVARTWLTKAYHNKFVTAFQELQNTEPEYNSTDKTLNKNLAKAKLISSAVNLNIDKYTPFKSTFKPNEISGDFQGYLLKYDWSKTSVLEAVPISFQINTSSTTIKGIFHEVGEKDSLKFAATFTNDKLVFQQAYFYRYDYYHKYPPLYQLKTADMRLLNNGLASVLNINIESDVIDMGEPNYPMTLILTKSTKIDNKAIQNSSALSAAVEETNVLKSGEQQQSLSLKAFPNPFQNEINVSFVLQEASKADIIIRNVEGKLLYSKPFENLKVGENLLTIPLKVPLGEYIVSLLVNDKIETLKIIKN
jgi:uncharacterized protein